MKKEKWSKRHSGGFRKWLITVLLAISVLMTGYSVLKEAVEAQDYKVVSVQ